MRYDDCARRACSFLRAVPPVPRQIPLFAAEPRAASLRTLGGGARRALSAGRRDRSRRDRLALDRTLGGRTYVPASAPIDGGEAFGYVSYTREHEGVQAAEFEAVADHTDETGPRQPRLDARPLRPRDRHWRPPGAPGRDHARLGSGAGPERGGRDNRARPDHDRPVRARGRPLHARIARRLHRRLHRGPPVRPRGAELVRESLYEDS